jgi:hypothetical protein
MKHRMKRRMKRRSICALYLLYQFSFFHQNHPPLPGLNPLKFKPFVTI